MFERRRTAMAAEYAVVVSNGKAHQLPSPLRRPGIQRLVRAHQEPCCSPPCNCTARSFATYWRNRKYARKSALGEMYAEALHAHIRCGRRRSSAPSLGRKMEARDSVPSIRREGDALLRPGTSDTQHHSKNAGAAAPPLGSGRNRCAEGLSSGTAQG